jgi:hypothetical protein
MKNANWVVNLATMSCKNTANCVTVRFVDSGGWVEGRIDDAPKELLSALARTAGGAAYLERQVRAAEEVFIPEFLQAWIAD